MDLSGIWDILVEHCGASERWRENFIEVAKGHIERGHDLEYRFQGDLGFGGKVYIERHRPPWVGCYSEDRTPARDKMVALANADLKAMGEGRLT